MSSSIVSLTFDRLVAEDTATGERTPLRIRSTARGFYIRTRGQRVSEYYQTFEKAEEDLLNGTFGRK